MLIRKYIITAFFFLFCAQATYADLWTTTQTWTPEIEKSYQDWVRLNSKVDMFSRQTAPDGTANPYYGLRTDCADTVYTLRIIFSFENGLPWAMKIPWNTKKILTNEWKKFDSKPEGIIRLRAFLQYAFDIIGTGSLPNDTYPISIKNIVPGTIIATSHTNHHSWTITNIDKFGVPRLFFNSSIGKTSGSLLQQRYAWPNPYWVFAPDEKKVNPDDPDSEVVKTNVFHSDSYAGYRYWIPYDKMQSDIKTIENYSTDQFDLDLKKWTTAPQAYYALAKEPPQDTITRLLSNTCDDVKQRIGAVKESDDYKSALAAAFLNPTDENSMAWINEFNSAKIVPENNQCLNSDKYDQYSTPSRDRRLFDGLMLARAYFTETLRLKGSKSISIAKLAQFKKIFTHPELSAEAEIASENKNSGISAQSICSLNVGTVDGKNITLDLAEIKRRFFKSYVSPNPNEDLLGRWGGKNHNRGELAKSCPTYGEEYPPYDLNGAEHKANAEAKAALE